MKQLLNLAGVRIGMTMGTATAQNGSPQRVQPATLVEADEGARVPSPTSPPVKRAGFNFYAFAAALVVTAAGAAHSPRLHHARGDLASVHRSTAGAMRAAIGNRRGVVRHRHGGTPFRVDGNGSGQARGARAEF